MRIESGTTWDRRFRLSLFLLMCIGMGGWFAYDGFKGYPAENLDWARQIVPGHPPDLQVNPRAIEKHLRQVKPGMSTGRVRDLLGEPNVIRPRGLRYVGPQVAATVNLNDDDQVTGVTIEETGPQRQLDNPSEFVTRARLEYIKPGMSAVQVRENLGRPAAELSESWWYVGPATYAEFPINNGQVAEGAVVQVSDKHSETDILLQKILAAMLAVLAIGVAIKLYFVIKTHVVVDDTGLAMNGRRIPWDAMDELITTDYERKGWVDLTYRANGSIRRLRLDSYHIESFDEIVNAICEQKGYDSPIRPPEPDDADVDGPDDADTDGPDADSDFRDQARTE